MIFKKKLRIRKNQWIVYNFGMIFEKIIIIGLWESPNDNWLFSNLWESTLWEPVNLKNNNIDTLIQCTYIFN
jgi:hypothetical protein